MASRSCVGRSARDALVKRRTPFSGGRRAADGITVFASRDDGESRAFELRGLPVKGALLAICDKIDALDGQWYIDVISSPSTIWRDLQGTRMIDRNDDNGPMLLVPEAKYLGAIGRLDLLRKSAA